MNQIKEEREKLKRIKEIAEETTKSFINQQFSNENMIRIIKRIDRNIQEAIPDFRNYISSINYKINPSTPRGTIIITYHTEVVHRHGIQDVIVNIK